MSSIDPLLSWTAASRYDVTETKPSTLQAAVAERPDAGDVITLSPEARMLMAITDMLAQAAGGADATLGGETLGVLDNIQRLATVPQYMAPQYTLPQYDATASPGYGAASQVPPDNGIAVADGNVPYAPTASLQLTEAVPEDASASQALQGNGVVVAAVPGDGTAGAYAVATLESDQPGEVLGSADASITAGAGRATAQVTGGSGNDWIAAYAIVANQ